MYELVKPHLRIASVIAEIYTRNYRIKWAVKFMSCSGNAEHPDKSNDRLWCFRKFSYFAHIYFNFSCIAKLIFDRTTNIQL